MSDSFPGTESLVCHVAYHLRTATVTILANPFAAALPVPSGIPIPDARVPF